MDNNDIVHKLEIHDNKIEAIQDKINNLDKNLIPANIYTNQFIETLKELSEAIKNIDVTMIKVQNNLDNNTKDINTLNLILSKLTEKVDNKLTPKVETEEKEKKKSALTHPASLGAMSGAVVIAFIELLKSIVPILDKMFK